MTDEKPKRTRLFFVDNLRTLLTVVVVLHHLAIVYGASGDFPLRKPGQMNWPPSCCRCLRQ